MYVYVRTSTCTNSIAILSIRAVFIVLEQFYSIRAVFNETRRAASISSGRWGRKDARKMRTPSRS